MGVARFVIQADGAGSIGLKLTKTKDVDLFVGDKEIRLEDNAGETVVPVKLAEGKTTVTVVGLLGFGLDEFRVEVVDAPGGGAKAQVTLPPVAEW